MCNVVVYKVVLDIDGHRELCGDKIAMFKEMKDAEEFVNNKTDTNGWTYYKIIDKSRPIVVRGT